MTPTTLAAAILRDVPKDALAKIVYDAMRFERQNDTPDWADGGNSCAQAEARHTAAKVQDAVLAALTAALDPALSERAGEVRKRLLSKTPNMTEGHAAMEAGADLITDLIAENVLLRVEQEELERRLVNTYDDAAYQVKSAIAAVPADPADAVDVLRGVTPGPWHVGQGDKVPFVGGGGFARADLIGPESDRLANARFIAWARNNVPALLAQIAALRKERETMIDAATVQKMLDDAQPIMAEACRGYEEANADLQARLTAAEAVAEKLRGALDAALASNRGLVRLNEATEARANRLQDALEEIAEYDTGATAGLAYTARAALPARGVGVKPPTLTKPDRAERNRRNTLTYDEQMREAEASCVPCKLCGGKAKITDAGHGYGYSIDCENWMQRDNECFQGGTRISGWAYNAAERWNELNALAPTDAAQADDPECTDCGGTGITYQTERRCACQPTDAAHVNETPKTEHDANNVLTDAQAREAALREAAAIAEEEGWLKQPPMIGFTEREEGSRDCAERIASAILALIGETRT